jgi:ribosomal protein L29
VEKPELLGFTLTFSTGGVANAYIPTAEEEEHEKKIQEQEAELMRVRTQSKDRVKEIEHERQELRRDSPSS